MYDTALGTYDAEQTNRLSSYFGERDTSFGDSILLKNPPTAIISTGDYRARLAILGSVGGSAHPCALSRIWGRSLKRKFAFLLT
ncbi:hypothetical protein [Desulfosporosinus burensis]